MDVNNTLEEVCKSLSIDLDKIETLLTLPIDFLKSEISNDGLIKYAELRSKLIKTLELVEVIVYDTNEDAPHCIYCGKEAHIDNDELNGVITHWISNGKIIHDFVCSECLDKQNN